MIRFGDHAIRLRRTEGKPCVSSDIFLSEVGSARFFLFQFLGIFPSLGFYFKPAMTHPLIPKILELATSVAFPLGLEVAGATFHTNQSPSVLRVDIRNPGQDTGLVDCARMSHALDVALDEADFIPEAYVLEVSSPGISETLTSDREFASFKGFPVVVTTQASYNSKTTWAGHLICRDEDAVHLSLKGRAIAIPRPLILSVQLDDHPDP